MSASAKTAVIRLRRSFQRGKVLKAIGEPLNEFLENFDKMLTCDKENSQFACARRLVP